MPEKIERHKMFSWIRIYGFVLTFSVVFLVAGSDAAHATELALEDPEVQACMARTLPETSLRQVVSFNVYDDGGKVSESRANMYWRRESSEDLARALVRFVDPPQRSGLALLAIEQSDPTMEPEIHMYLPQLRSRRRIVGSVLGDSMFGTHFSYEDFARLQGAIREKSTRRLDDKVVNERPVYVFEVVPAAAQTQYARIVSAIDQVWCVPVNIRFYDHSETLLKELTVDPEQVVAVDDRWIPYRLTMHDRKEGGNTQVHVQEIEFDPELRKLMFSPSELARGR